MVAQACKSSTLEEQKDEKKDNSTKIVYVCVCVCDFYLL